MRFLLFYSLLFAFNVPLGLAADEKPVGQPSDEHELSDKEADAIVLGEVRKSELAKAQKGETMAENTPVASRRNIRKGRRTSFEKIDPPAASSILTTLAADRDRRGVDDSRESIDEAAIEEKREILSISATVYDREVTELRWSSDGERGLAYSNIDFSLFRNVHKFESGGKKYQLNLGLGEEARSDDPKGDKRLPTVEAFASSGTYNLASPMVAESREAAALLAGLDTLHRYYRENERQLKIADQRRRALSAARKRYRAANPPEDDEVTVIQFWREERDGAPTE